MFFYFKYLSRKSKISPKRYKNLLELIYQNKCKKIIEVGVFNGKNSGRMIDTAKARHKAEKIEYYGFDLFEKISDEEIKTEFSKKPFSRTQIMEKLKPTGAKIELFAGYSQETLPQFVKSHPDLKPDFIYIDGGHHIDTVTSDWNNLCNLMHNNTIVVFDDYYELNHEGLEEVGCNKLIESLDKNKYDIKILQPQDQFEKEWGILKINFVKVTLR